MAIALDASALQNVLRSAASNNTQQIATATSQLQQWETQEGFYGLLQDVFLQSSKPAELRMLALIQLKNGIEKYWRKSAVNAISANERNLVRSRLLQSGLAEGSHQLAAMNALITAKVVRVDFPNQWPDLFKEINDLLAACLDQPSPSKELSRMLILILQIIKELSTVRLQKSRYNLFSVTPELFQVLRRAYQLRLQQWIDVLSGTPNPITVELMHETELLLKILRRLLPAGYEFPHTDSSIRDFWSLSGTQMSLYLQQLQYQGLALEYRMKIGRHLIQLAKLHLNVADTHPISFALLPDTSSLVRRYWETAKAMRYQQIMPLEQVEDLEVVYEAYNLRALRLLRVCFRLVYSSTHPFKFKSSAQYREDPSSAKKLIQTSLLSDTFIMDLCEGLINRFFLLIPSDVQEWLTEPEEWEMKETGSGEDIYDIAVRPCAERVLLDIVLHHRQLVLEPLKNLLALATAPGNQDLRMKDAAYSAIGISASMLNGEFDFNHFLTTTLVEEVQKDGANSNILRRRIAILLAQWVAVDISQPNRPLVYEIYWHLLDGNISGNDQAVRIAAAKHLRDVVDEMQFTAQQFAPFAPKIIQQLLSLTGQVSQSETKIALLATLSSIIERMEHEIEPFAAVIIELLPTLWESSRENMVKQAIVAILAKLVHAMKAESIPVHGMMLPIIKSALDPNSETQLFLLDDALDLLSAIISQTRAPAAVELLALITSLFPILELNLEYVEKTLRILNSYALLAPTDMLRDDIRDVLWHSLAPLLVMRKLEIIDAATEIIQLLIRAADALGDEPAVRVVADGLSRSPIMPRMLSSIGANWQHRESQHSAAVKRFDPPNDWRNETSYFSIFARLVMASTEIFCMIIQSQEIVPVNHFLEEWFRHMDEVGDPTKRKLMALALTKLLESGQPWILAKLQDLMTLCTDLVTELRDGDSTADSLVYQPPDSTSLNGQSPEDERRRLLTYSDPVHTLDLGHHIRHHLSNAIMRCGGEQKFQEEWLGNVDKDVIKAFSELGTM